MQQYVILYVWSLTAPFNIFHLHRTLNWSRQKEVQPMTRTAVFLFENVELSFSIDHFFCLLLLIITQLMIFNVQLSEPKLLHPKGSAVLWKEAHWWQSCRFRNDLGWLLLPWHSLERDTKSTTYTKTKYPWRQIATKDLESIKTWASQTWVKAKESGRELWRKPNASKVMTINTKTPVIHLGIWNLRNNPGSGSVLNTLKEFL